MSGYYNLGKNLYKGFQKVFDAARSSSTPKNLRGNISTTIVGVKPGKNLKKRFDTKQDIIKSIDKQAGPNVSNQAKSKIKKEAGEKVSKIYDKYEKKATGGRVGRRFGNPNPKKTNVQKIKETFGPKNTKKLSSKQMKIAKLAGNPNKIDGADFKKLRNR
jgi:hypothetical protein